jgi:cytochrome P450
MNPMRFLDPALLDDPYPHYAHWQESSPIWRDETLNAWILTRHDDVRAVLKDSTTYSSAAMGQGIHLPLLMDDPPRHTQLRSLVDRAFTVRRLRAMEDRVGAIAADLVAAMPQGEPVDIVQRLTTPLPVAVIAEMMGIPAARGDDFKRWSDALTGTAAGASVSSRQQEVGEMAAFFHALIPARREFPADDLVSAVVNADVDGNRLSDADIVGFNMLLLIAGNETTTNLLGNLLNILADQPDHYSALRNDPKLIDAAIEETLRFDAPVQFVIRQATAPIVLHGHSIAAGDLVYVLMGAANRDPRAYDAPGCFRLDRERNHHHTFGFGIHFCMGAPLARLEARIAMQTLLARFPRLRRADNRTSERVPSPMLRGFHHLWLTF